MRQMRNKKAFFNYDLDDHFEAGLVLKGDEIKAVRAGKVSLDGSFAKILYNAKRKPELWLVNAHLGSQTLSPTRSRKLLVHRHEINKLIGKLQTQGLTLVPTKIYLKKGVAKVALALGRGRKTHDKRELIKKRDIERELKQHTKG